MTKISFRRRIACSCNRSCATVTFSKLCLATRIVTSIRRWSQPITVNDVTRITGVYVGWDKVSRHSVNPHLSPKVRMRWSRRPHAAEVSRPRSENVPAQRSTARPTAQAAAALDSGRGLERLSNKVFRALQMPRHEDCYGRKRRLTPDHVRAVRRGTASGRAGGSRQRP